MMERFFGGRMPQNRGPRSGAGSGVIFDAREGLIITNNHVIKDADEITVTLNDRREYEAELVGTDPDTDIALLKIDARDLDALRLAKSGDARVGDYVIAVGNPFGLTSTVTSGIVSAIGRETASGNNRYENYIQTDADLRDGLGLKSLNGALISDVSEGSAAEKAGLQPDDVVIEFNGEDVVDSNDLRNFVGLLQPGTRVDITYLRDNRRRTTQITVKEAPDLEDETITTDDDGNAVMEAFDGAEISNIPEDVELRGGQDGVYISAVESGSRAARAGLRRGDVIRRVGKTDIRDLDDFQEAIESGNGPYALRVERQGQTRIEAGNRTRGMHGKALRQLDIGFFGCVEKTEQSRFFRMIGLRGIPRRRANAGIFLGNQIVARGRFIRRIAPIFAADTLMEMFGKSFREAVT